MTIARRLAGSRAVALLAVISFVSVGALCLSIGGALAVPPPCPGGTGAGTGGSCPEPPTAVSTPPSPAPPGTFDTPEVSPTPGPSTPPSTPQSSVPQAPAPVFDGPAEGQVPLVPQTELAPVGVPQGPQNEPQISVPNVGPPVINSWPQAPPTLTVTSPPPTLSSTPTRGTTGQSDPGGGGSSNALLVVAALAATIAAAVIVALVITRYRRNPDRPRRLRDEAPGSKATHRGPIHLAPEPPARHLIAAVVDSTRSALPPTAVLVPNANYELQVNIGLPRGANAASRSADMPPGSSPGAWFDVFVVSADIDVASEPHRFFVPPSGSGWVCDCRQPEHTCSPGDRRSSVFIPIRTRSRFGPASLRCIVYSRNNVVQTTRLDVAVGAGRLDRENMREVVDFGLAGDVGRGNQLPRRDLSILTNESSSGTHTIVICDGLTPEALFINEQQAEKVLAACREKLTRIVLNRDRTATQYDRDNRKPAAAFIADLKGLALVGSRLYGAIASRSHTRALFRDRLKRRSTIQISRVTRTAFPWALVYDMPREGQADWILCRLLREWETAADRLGDYPDRCPYEAEHERINVLCPYGFWGFRHLLEEPPSIDEGLLRTTIRVSTPAKVALVRSLALNHELATRHFAALQSYLCPPFEALACDSRESLRSALADPALPLMYFYCHGARARFADSDIDEPVLQIGESDNIVPGDFGAWHDADLWTDAHWVDTAPLVFINGCETVKTEPKDLITFVEALAGLRVAGVIGTEIPVDQTIAGEVAVNFFRQLCGDPRATVGMALHRTRIDLLRKGNVSGLVYTPYCSMDLAMDFAAPPEPAAAPSTYGMRPAAPYCGVTGRPSVPRERRLEGVD